jgi:predicted ATP-binding protein involved in virulence
MPTLPISIDQDAFRVSEIELANFRCFKEQSFAFPERFTILIGDNGSGKSTVLEALSIGVGAVFLGIDGQQAPSIASEQARINRYELGQTSTLEPRYPIAVRCKGIWQGQDVRWARTRQTQDGRTLRRGANKLVDRVKETQSCVREGKRTILPVISFYSTGRLWRRQEDDPSSLDEPGSRFKGYNHCLDPASHTALLMRWIKTQEMISIQEKERNRVFEAVKKAIVTCVDGLEDISYSIRQGDLLATFANGSERSTTPFRLLSEGYRNMLAMVADIAHRAATLNPQLEQDAAAETPGIVLIDELDLHLHPKWQYRVVEDLRRAFPRMQFIATTHSPIIVQSLRPGELIDLHRGPKGEYANRSIEDIVEDVMGIDKPQRSRRYQRMFETAQQYYQVLEEAKGAPSSGIDSLKHRLDELVEPFSDNVAYHAFLQMRRIAAGLGDDDDETD